MTPKLIWICNYNPNKEEKVKKFVVINKMKM